MPNAELAYKILDQIDAHPEQWVQNHWMTTTECGTAYCFAGWAVNLSGGTLQEDVYNVIVASGPPEIDGLLVERAADVLLGICSRDLPEDLYDGYNCRRDLDRIVADVFGPRPQAAVS